MLYSGNYVATNIVSRFVGGRLKKMFANDFANASPDEQKLLDEIVKNSTKRFGRRR